MTIERRTDHGCREAFDRLYAYLDGELTEDQHEAVRRHLAACRDCFAVAEFESAYLRFVEARTPSGRAPEHLRKRILRSLLFGERRPEP